MQDVHYKGQWWLPNESDKILNGEFSFTRDEGGKLELYGSGVEILKEVEERILGITQDGKEVTLSNCLKINHSIGFGFSSFTFNVNQAYIGCHFNEEVTFRNVYINFNLLNDWANLTGIHPALKIDHKVHFPVNYKVPAPIRIFQNEEFEIHIEIIGNFQINKFEQKKVEISETTYFKIKFLMDEYGIEDILSINNHLRNFLSLATLEPVDTLELFGDSEKNNIKEVKIFYKPIAKANFIKGIPPSKMLFNFKDIQETSQEKIKKWFKKADILEPVFSLYFAVIHNPPSFTDERFLFLIQALEVYHRRIGEGKELPEQEHQERIQKILETVPRQYKDWLEGKLEYSNELSLRKRLKEIYDEFSCILNSFMKRKCFINLTVDTRNYLTHYDEKLKESCARGNDLFYLSRRLEIILQLCFLKELGFTKDEIKNLFKRYQSWQPWLFTALET